MCLPVFAIGLYWCICNYFLERMLLHRMRRRGRYLHPAQIRSATGTLIIEEPALGWNHTRLWWTAEDVRGRAPTAPPVEFSPGPNMSPHPFDRWFWDTYVKTDSAGVYLVGTWNGEALSEWVRSRIPDLPVVRTWTGICRAMEDPAVRHRIERA